jgi:hypothetical protein
MKSWFIEHVYRPFIRTQMVMPWFGPVFTTVLLALSVNVLSTALTTWGGVGWSLAVMAVLMAAMVLYARAISDRMVRSEPFCLKEVHNPPKKQGLLFLFQFNQEPLMKAVEYHRPDLQRCWLLATPELKDQAEAAARNIEALYSEIGCTALALSSLYDTADCYRAALDVFDRRAAEAALSPAHLIADITGGTKPMTIGVMLACFQKGYAIEHVPAVYDEVTHKPIRTLDPIQVAIESQPPNPFAS